MFSAYFSPHQVSTILEILINFKFTHTHKKQQQQKTMYIFKKQAVPLTNRLNFKSKRVRD